MDRHGDRRNSLRTGGHLDLMTAYQGDSPSDLAQRILQQSEEICQGEDDGTVLAVHLERGKEG